MSPVMAAVLSIVLCCLPGLPQFMLGPYFKGAVLFVLYGAFSFASGFVSTPVIMSLLAMDAYAIASKLQQGRSVGQWEFF
jgi:hypothetical protein